MCCMHRKIQKNKYTVKYPKNKYPERNTGTIRPSKEPHQPGPVPCMWMARSWDPSMWKDCTWDPHRWEPCTWKGHTWDPCMWDPCTWKAACGISAHGRPAGGTSTCGIPACGRPAPGRPEISRWVCSRTAFVLIAEGRMQLDCSLFIHTTVVEYLGCPRFVYDAQCCCKHFYMSFG